jgi:hypothetical protein
LFLLLPGSFRSICGVHRGGCARWPTAGHARRRSRAQTPPGAPLGSRRSHASFRH